MPKIRKSHPPSLKAKVAVEAIKAHKTAAQIAQMFGSMRPRWAAGRNRPWPGCPTSSATAASRCASRPMPRRTNSTNRSAN
jgi:hypothetical protein